MQHLLEHFNCTVPKFTIIDYRDNSLSLDIILEGSRALQELTQYNADTGFLIINSKTERDLLRNLHADRMSRFYNSLHGLVNDYIIAGFRCSVSNDLPRFASHVRWSYMLSNEQLVGILTYEPPKTL